MTPTTPEQSDQASKPRMTPAEREEMCICAAATAVVSYVLSYGYEDITVDDDGYGWPTTSSDVTTGYWPIGDDPGPTGNGEPSPDVAYRDIATIYEAGDLRNPWQFINTLVLIDLATKAIYTFSASSRGGLSAIAELCKTHAKKAPAGTYPVVRPRGQKVTGTIDPLDRESEVSDLQSGQVRRRRGLRCEIVIRLAR